MDSYLENQGKELNASGKRELTDEMIGKLLSVYESSMDDLQKVAEIIDECGVLDSGVTDIYDTYEMGYNSALQYVFKVLGIQAQNN